MPVGLSYSDVIKFKSDVVIKYGNPIRLNDFKNDYLENEFDTVKSITGKIELALRNLTTNVNIIESEEVVSALESIYKKELMLELGLDVKNTSDEFAATKGWLMELSGILKTNPIK